MVSALAGSKTGRWPTIRPGLGVVVLACLTLTGCFVGPSASPLYAVERPAPTAPGDANQPPADSAASPIPSSVSWRDCALTATHSLPAGLTSQCAEYHTQGRMAGALDLSLDVVRLMTPQTRSDAPPVFLLTDPNEAASAYLARISAAIPAEALTNFQLIAVDHRAQGVNGFAEGDGCLWPQDEAELATLSKSAEFGTRIEESAAISSGAANECIGATGDDHMYFGIDTAVNDLLNLQAEWQLSSMNLWALGAGTQTALAFAELAPEAVRTLIADSPRYLGEGQLSHTEQQSRGLLATLDLLLRECGQDCLGLSAQTLLDDALSGIAGRPGAESTPALLASVLAFRLAALPPRVEAEARRAGIADIVAALRSATQGDSRPWRVGAAGYRWDTARFITECSATGTYATREEITQFKDRFTADWGELGAAQATTMMRCSGWPQGNTAPTVQLSGRGILVLQPAADPLVGPSEYTDSTLRRYESQGASTAVLRWQGYGHGVGLQSQCTSAPLLQYWELGTLPAEIAPCPA